MNIFRFALSLNYPMKKREQLAIIRDHYPNAVTTNDAINQVIDYIGEKLDLEPHEVLMADSICADDVNSIQYPTRASEFLGPFKLGGLDGFPFTGQTGMIAFAGHVPVDGALFIYYGPHIGISKEGELGKILRFGQNQNSGSCGAAILALGNLTNNRIEAGKLDDSDYQLNTIEQILLRQKDRITDAKEPLKEATEVIYEAIDERINKLVADNMTKYKCRYVILMGAILINGDRDMGSFSETKRFSVIEVATSKRDEVL